MNNSNISVILALNINSNLLTLIIDHKYWHSRFGGHCSPDSVLIGVRQFKIRDVAPFTIDEIEKIR